MRHITGIPRQQLVLFPESLDEYISADDPVRFIDVIVDSLDLAAAGFTQTTLAETGRPPYDPRDMWPGPTLWPIRNWACDEY